MTARRPSAQRNTADGRIVAEDSKCISNPLYRAKKHLLAVIQNIHVMEV